MWLLPGAGSCHCHCCDTSGRRCCFSLVSGVKGILGRMRCGGGSAGGQQQLLAVPWLCVTQPDKRLGCLE